MWVIELFRAEFFEKVDSEERGVQPWNSNGAKFKYRAEDYLLNL